MSKPKIVERAQASIVKWQAIIAAVVAIAAALGLTMPWDAVSKAEIAQVRAEVKVVDERQDKVSESLSEMRGKLDVIHDLLIRMGQDRPGSFRGRRDHR